jgi:N-acetylglucosaminyldiphosphoundecaprenol N-acetyl-beta-D-mannosaminyltransferase
MDSLLLTVSILGTNVAVMSKNKVASRVIKWATNKDKAYGVALADVHVITRARHEQSFKNALKQFDLICPDGMPLIWKINCNVESANQLNERVSGADLMKFVIAEGITGDIGKHFFLGGSTKLLLDLEKSLKSQTPNIGIAEMYSPPFGEWADDEFDRISHKITDSGANLVWVGLGCPKQERWIGDNLHRLPPAVYFSVGAAFAFHAGHVSRAPKLVQSLGVEWLYRLLIEPKRLFKRYATYIPLYFYYSILECIDAK